MPTVPIHRGLFTEPGDARGPLLLAGVCTGCRRHHFPAAESCPYCGAGEVSIAAVGAHGRLYLHTVVNAAPPGYRGPVPYGFGLVDLPEGLRVVTRLGECDLERLAPGMEMHLEIAPLFTDDEGNEVLSYSYTPSGKSRS